MTSESPVAADGDEGVGEPQSSEDDGELQATGPGKSEGGSC